ncbi:DsbA family protein [Candidatus Saccharibacteria bacterium]|nr:DsbA family protein [Candidatus Saccharibacteria bacterium]
MGKVKIILTVVVVVFVVALIVFNASNPAKPDALAWNSSMTKGDPETGKHFVMYTDVFCPYCDKFSNSLHANAEEFMENYIDNGKVYYEVRVTDINFLSGHSVNSEVGGESAYCAAKQDKFWGYYKALLDKLYEDWHSNGIGVSKDAEKIPKLDNDYFYEIGEEAELDGEVFKACIENHEALDELNTATSKTQKIIPGGIPYFVFGNYKASGFDGNWDTDNDWKQARLMLDAGL